MRKQFSFILLLVIAFILVACNNKPSTKVPCVGNEVVNVINGGFETGDLTGWTAEGAAFDVKNVTIKETFWQENIPFGQTGNYHLYGISDGMYQDGTEIFKSELTVGTLTSSVFTLCGDGKISFKLGAARNHDNLFVEVRLKEDDKLIARQANTQFADFSGVVDPNQAINGLAYVNNYATYTLDLTDVDGVDYRGKEMYVRLVDNAAHGDFGFLNFDDLRTYYVDGVAEPQAEGSTANYQYLTRSCDGVVAASLNEIANPGFESGNLCGWEIVEGEAFHDAGVNGEATWWAEAITYNRDGNYHFGMYNEAGMGVLKSTTFTLGGAGFMTFKLGGNGGYVSIFNDADEEIARFGNSEFADINFPNVDAGMRLANMVLYKVDLTAFAALGDQLYIQITDNKTSGWGLMTFDSFDTLHMTEPAEGVEAINILPIVFANQIENGGFETGDLTGWTVLEGEAFAAAGINSEPTWWAESITYNRDGNYHFGMYNEGATGVMRSENFTLSGSGYMTFKLGGNGGYVSIHLIDGTEIARFENSEFADINFPNVDQGMRLANMVLYKVNVDQYANLGDNLYIQIVDNKTSGWGLMTFDSFVTFYETAPTEGVEAIDIRPIPVDVQPASKYEIANPGFESGTLDGWTILNGAAFDNAGVTADATWWAEQITYNRDGEYHYGMYNEGAIGTIKSTTFELGGSGFITFKLGGRGGYVSIFTAAGVEIARFANSEFANINFPHVDQGMRLMNMVQYKVDLTQFAALGDILYIQITDNQTSDFGFMSLDSFFTYHEAEPVDGVVAINILT